MCYRGIVLCLVAGLASLAAPHAADAQFNTPLPPPLPDEVARRHLVASFLRDSVEAAEPDAEEVEVDRLVRAAICHRNREERALFEDACRRGEPIKGRDVAWYRVPFDVRRHHLVRFREALGGTEDFDFFRRFSGSVTDEEILVLTELLSGGVGVFDFGLSHAAVVVNKDGQDGIPADTVENLTSSLLRLINNGGSLSGRFGYTLFAFSGTNLSGAGALHVSTGMVGPLGEPDSLRFSVSPVLETMLGMAIRSPTTGSELKGQIFLGGRFGLAYVDGPLSPGTYDRESFPFLQLGVGIETLDRFGISVLITYPLRDEPRRFVPRTVINLTALKL